MRSFVKISRVALLAGAMLSLIALSGARVHAGDASSERSQEHALRLYNTHTGERLEIVFRRGEQYIPGALAKLDYFLRDHNTGDVRHFDPRLYDTLADLTASIGHPDGEIDIVCGYRTPSTNESLRAHTTGVARTACTFRRKRLIFACLELTHLRCAEPRWPCVAVVWVIIRTLTSFMLILAACGSGVSIVPPT